MWRAQFDATAPRPADYYQPLPTQAGYASWLSRVVAALLDGLVVSVPLLVGQVVLVLTGGRFASSDLSDASTLGLAAYVVGILASVALGVWNTIVRQGRTGQSLAKSWMGIRLVQQATGAPLGPGRTLLRMVAHILDALPCYLGFLWPLWDSERQTFADKVMGSVVIAA